MKFQNTYTSYSIEPQQKPKVFKRQPRDVVPAELKKEVTGLTHECGVFGAIACGDWPTQVSFLALDFSYLQNICFHVKRKSIISAYICDAMQLYIASVLMKSADISDSDYLFVVEYFLEALFVCLLARDFTLIRLNIMLNSYLLSLHFKINLLCKYTLFLTGSFSSFLMTVCK